MYNKELQLLENLESELKLYKIGLSEIIVAEYEKEKAIEKLSEIKEDIVKYVMVGEVLHGITSNYVYLKPILDVKGEFVGCQKCYSVKADDAIEGSKNILKEATIEYEGEEYIELIKKELAKYRKNTIFTELHDVEEGLSGVNSSSDFFKDNIKELLDSIKEFNMLDEAIKMEELNSFSNENIEYLKGSVVLMKLYNDYNGVNIIYDVNMHEYGGIFYKWDKEKLEPVLNWNEEYYFRIMKDINYLMEASEAEYDIDLVKKQLKCVDKLENYIGDLKSK